MHVGTCVLLDSHLVINDHHAVSVADTSSHQL